MSKIDVEASLNYDKTSQQCFRLRTEAQRIDMRLLSDPCLPSKQPQIATESRGGV